MLSTVQLQTNLSRIRGVKVIHQRSASHSGVWLQSMGSIYWDVLPVGLMWMRSWPVGSLRSSSSSRVSSPVASDCDGFSHRRTVRVPPARGVALSRPQVRCGRSGGPMRAVRRGSAAPVQTSAPGLRREGPRARLRLLPDLRAQLRPAVRSVHRKMRRRTHLPASARWNQAAAGSDWGTGHVRERHEQETRNHTSGQWIARYGCTVDPFHQYLT